MSLELISLVPVTLLWVSNVHLDYWHRWGGEIGQLRKRWNEEDEEMGQFIWFYQFPSLTVSDMPLIHNVLERKHPGQERGRGECSGALLSWNTFDDIPHPALARCKSSHGKTHTTPSAVTII